MSRRKQTLESVLAAIDKHCAREKRNAARYEEESYRVRMELVVTFLEAGASEARASMPAASTRR